MLCDSEPEDAGVAEVSSVREVESEAGIASLLPPLPPWCSAADGVVACEVTVPPKDVESMVNVFKATDSRLGCLNQAKS